MATRDYIFYELTNSVCSQCLKKLEAKIIIQQGNVYLLKNCPAHGREKVLISTDVDYYKKCRDFNKPSDMPKKFNTAIKKGCPYDCGLCPDHEQHSCVTLIEVTERCNLSCPTCYAASSPSEGRHRTLAEIETMLDVAVANEGVPDVVQISGGEPTIHPDFFQILDLAKQKPIQHLMLNTNGVKIAKDREFTKKLASYMPGFEVYLQFDSFESKAWQSLRGLDLSETKAKAVAHLNEFNLSTTLVVTLQNGLNTHEIGKLIDFAVKQQCVRGVTFQPTQIAGRVSHFDPKQDRITLSEVRTAILEQTDLFSPEDLIPVPCHPDAITMGYALKLGDEIVPLTRYFSPETLLSTSRNTINFEQVPEVTEKIYNLFSTSCSTETASDELKSLMCCLPKIEAPELKYDNLFRVIIMQFYDAYNMDIRGVKKSCVHIVHQDGRVIPFDTMNVFHRHSETKLL
jgi:uncharacterized radical SAM superfamily Fe-S cluster-containing enzyme